MDMMTMGTMTKDVLDFKENMKEFEQHFINVVSDIKYVDDLGSVLEYSSDNGVLFTVDVMDEDGNYIFNFGDVSFHVNEEAFNLIHELIDKKVE